MTSQQQMREGFAKLRWQSEKDARMRASERDELYDKGVHPDMVFAALDRYVLCTRDVKFIWDQWMKCRIVCRHGEFSGASWGLVNPMGQSMASAFAKFKAVDHDMCVDDDHLCFEESHYDLDDMTIDACPTCGLTANGARCVKDGKFCYANV